jgi:hypothetical protein
LFAFFIKNWGALYLINLNCFAKAAEVLRKGPPPKIKLTKIIMSKVRKALANAFA